MAKEKCKVEQCNRPREGNKEYCLAHYRQIIKHGQIISEAIAIRYKNRKCSVKGCDEKYHSNGYCLRHFSQFRRHGKIISVDRINAPRIGQRMKSGYMYILKKDHPRADKRGYVKRSWLVWEEHTGHVVIPPEVVHHINEIKTDDRFENLKLLPNKSAHIKEHGGRLGGVRIVTKEIVVEEMLKASKTIDGNLTIRKFQEISGLSGTAIKKLGWNNLKEELCIP